MSKVRVIDSKCERFLMIDRQEINGLVMDYFKITTQFWRHYDKRYGVWYLYLKDGYLKRFRCKRTTIGDYKLTSSQVSTALRHITGSLGTNIDLRKIIGKWNCGDDDNIQYWNCNQTKLCIGDCDKHPPVRAKDFLKKLGSKSINKGGRPRRLSDDKITLIRISNLSTRTLAKELGVSHNLIHLIRKGYKYKTNKVEGKK